MLFACKCDYMKFICMFVWNAHQKKKRSFKRSNKKQNIFIWEMICFFIQAIRNENDHLEWETSLDSCFFCLCIQMTFVETSTATTKWNDNYRMVLCNPRQYIIFSSKHKLQSLYVGNLVCDQITKKKKSISYRLKVIIEMKRTAIFPDEMWFQMETLDFK